MPPIVWIALGVGSVAALLFALVHDANTRRMVQQRATATSRPPVQQRPGRDARSVLDQPWWENA
jgi:hypothetical protein